eukprot:7607482-Alexandrium_andersonii.AAC.1
MRPAHAPRAPPCPPTPRTRALAGESVRGRHASAMAGARLPGIGRGEARPSPAAVALAVSALLAQRPVGAA